MSSAGRRPLEPSADIVVGLGWGDEGKGATVDALAAANRPNRVVRFNGGQQAAHNVIANGVHHTFSSYGSGVFSDVDTWISRFCTVDPLAIAEERIALRKKNLFPLLFVDEEAPVTTAIHIAANISRDSVNNHGTTGTGFGETVYYSLHHDALRVKHLRNLDTILDYIVALNNFYQERGLVRQLTFGEQLTIATELQMASSNFNKVRSEHLTEALQSGYTVFEGAQGFVLDENFGFSPHTTWSTTTPANARKLLREAGVENVRTIGCLRTYATRHGNGPLPHEGKLPFRPEEPHNADDNTQGLFRVAPHDPDIIEWAVDTTGVDALSISHLDVFDKMQTSCGMMSLEELPKPVLMEAYGPRREDRIFR